LAALPALSSAANATTDATFAEAVAAVNDPDLEDELGELAAVKTETLSWTGPPPTADDGSWAELRAHLLSKGNPAHPLAFHFLHAETWKRHIRMIKSLIPETAFDSWPAVTALLEILERRRRSRQWAWTSMCRAMAETQGAFNNLPILRGTAPIRLCDFPAWVQALKGAAARARSERPRIPFAATAASIDTAMASTNHLGKKRLLALSWLLAGRTGDCRQLREDDISRDGNVLTVTFRRGKTVSRRGPYSLHTVIPEQWLWLFDTKGWEGTLRSATVKDILLCLRAADSRLENRSIRRGALQRLASELTEDELLLFSGHTTLATLRRYLQWGAIGNKKKTLMTAAARTLAPTVGGHTVVGGNPHYLTARHERWMQFLGCEAPPSHHLPGSITSVDGPALPLASKNVAASVNVTEAVRLAHDPQLRAFATETTRWLHDERLYHALLASPSTRNRRQANCKLTDTEIEIQLQLKKYEEISDRAEQVALWCRVFAVPQVAKGNSRHICEPLLNDYFRDTPTVRFLDAAERNRRIGRFAGGGGGGGWAVELDFASWFDQLPLSESVRKFFGIRGRAGRTFRMKVMPMGFRPSAAVGQAVTWCVCDFERSPDIDVLTYIDNILVLATTREGALRAAEHIIRRAMSVGAVFSEADAEDTSTQAAVLRGELSQADALERRIKREVDKLVVSQTFNFLGAHYDLRDSTIRQSQKTYLKVQQLARFFAADDTGCTARQLAAAVGLLLFASWSCASRHNISNFRDAIQFYRKVASAVSSGAQSWSSPVHLAGTPALTAFQLWANELLLNTPAPISPPPRDEANADLLFVDASETGWGAVHIRQGSAQVIGAAWGADDRRQWDLGSSVASEPLGIIRALGHCRLPSPSPAASTGAILVYTDHQPIVAACASPCAKGYAYWRLQQFLLHFPRDVRIAYIPGNINPADERSRGRSTGATWHAIFAEALKHHTKNTTANGENGDSGKYPEWYATARNPNRPLFG
jgi:hypothetical protein